ncbi:glycogen debranching protein GlgX [Nakamurella flava]|uniref:Glycogen debranching protein GlgX n=1 Tax=Nakamurella flava TaxID=2576308 RepID=A0A4U6QLI2_9ACTN|nr:glycogen debranching protein GlgX [Nakamurella flava]TKV61201.1 glycogen debranching protein GlgX [Nakamurella flava]
MQVIPGRPHPLGVTTDPHAGPGCWNVAVASSAAERVWFCLLDTDPDTGGVTETRVELPAVDAGVWHGRVLGLRPGQRYGFRVDGPWDPAAGQLANPAKLLVDPYARAVVGDLVVGPAIYAHDVDDPSRPSTLDSAGSVPHSVIVAGAAVGARPDWNRPDTAIADTVLYELHVKGFTQLHPDVPAELRGTYAGLAHPAAVAHLTDLGITAVELLPVQHHVAETFLLDKGLDNYWGYNTIGFHAPHPGYSAAARAGDPAGAVDEFQDMVRTLHAAGIAVILDVVYNHTAEAGPTGPTLAYRGLDNANYYRLAPEDPSAYIDTTGCGNSLNVGHPTTLRLILDSLRYWVTEMGVDGFRFDLAPTLARSDGAFSDHAAFFEIAAQDPVLAEVTLIAEPWDVGQGDSYDIGRFPPGWSEWNGRFRDTVRDFWRSHDDRLPDLVTRFLGSADLYGGDRLADRRGPDASINLVTVHDGFTLADLVSYDHKHNEANGEDNRDGTDDNRSWNCGVEGPTDDPTVVGLRAAQTRALLATLLLARGVPLLLGGDERGRSQQGNNNAYCQDSALSWWDWTALRTPAAEALHAFTRDLLRVRRDHPVLRRHRYPPAAGERCYTPAGDPMTGTDWADGAAKSVTIVLDGRVEPVGSDPERAPGAVAADTDVLAVLVNAWWEPLDFTVPADVVGAGDDWCVVVDSLTPDRAGTTVSAGRVTVGPRSLLLLTPSSMDRPATTR